MTDNTAERLVGGFLIAVSCAFALLSVVAGLGDEFRNPGAHYTLVLDTGYGIAPGLPVTVRGMTVGRVEAVNLTEDRRVQLVLHVDTAFRDQIRTDTSGQALFSMSGKVIEVGDGTHAQLLADGGSLREGLNNDPAVSLQRMAGGDEVDRLAGVLGDVRAILERIDVEDARIPMLIDTTLRIADDLQAGRGSLGRLLVDDKVVTDIEGAVGKIDQVVTRLDTLAERLDRTAEALEQTSRTVTAQAASIEGTSRAVESSSAAVESAVRPIPDALSDLDRTLGELERTMKAIQELPLIRGKLEP